MFVFEKRQDILNFLSNYIQGWKLVFESVDYFKNGSTGNFLPVDFSSDKSTENFSLPTLYILNNIFY